MSWLEALPQYLVFAAAVFLPGLLVGWAIGLHGLLRYAAAAPAAVAGFSCTAVVYPLLRVPWNPWTVLLGFLLVAAVLRLTLRGGRPPRSWSALRRSFVAGGWSVVLGSALAVVLVARKLTYLIGAPGNVSQTYDAIFHYNALRYILDTGMASSMTLGGLGVTPNPSFYPGGWHATAVFATLISRVDIFSAANAMTLLTGSVVWGLGIVYCSMRLVGRHPVVPLAAGVLAAGFPAFPVLLSYFGNLFPNALSVAILPTAVGLLTDCFGFGPSPTAHHPGRKLLTLLIVFVGMGFAQPSSALFFLAVVWSYFAWSWLRAVFLRRWWLSAVEGLALIGGVLLLRQLWFAARGSLESSVWKQYATQAQAFGEALAPVSPAAQYVPWVLLVLVVLGIGYQVRKQAWWLLGSWGYLVALYVVVTSVQDPLRWDWTGLWYNDYNRVLATLVVFAVPLAVSGVMVLRRVLVTRTRPWLPVERFPAAFPKGRGAQGVAVRRGLRALLTVFCVIGGTLLLRTPAMAEVVAAGRATYGTEYSHAVLSPDELALLHRLDEEVPEDGLIYGNPMTGASLAYAVSDRRVLVPHRGIAPGGDAGVIVRSLDELGSNPAVCDAVDKYGLTYVLDFGEQEVLPLDYGRHSLDDIDSNSGFQLVDRQGDARLYKIVGC